MTAAGSAARAALGAQQLAALNRLLQAILPGNRFYARKWAQAGAPAQFDTLADFFACAPFTQKSELIEDQRAQPPYGSNLTFLLQDYTRYHQTSGSTGTPLRWLDTNAGWQWMLENWKQVYAAAEVTAQDRLFFAFSFGPFLGFWTAFEAATQLGSLCIPGGGLSSAARLRMMLDNHVTVLCCTPTYALRLAEVAAAEGLDLRTATVRRLIVAGEPGGSIAETRARLTAAWPQATVIDHHGMTEIGPVSVQDRPEALRLRVFENAYLAEVLDPTTGVAVKPGTLGELVLTTLGREGSPLIRYRTGDLVRPVYLPAGAGTDATATPMLQLEGGILGRIDDMAIVRGVNVYPAAVEAILRRHPEAAEYRVTLSQSEALTEMQVEIEPGAATVDAAGLARKIEQALRDAFQLRVPVIAVTPGSLPRFELKARRWIRSGPNG